MTNFDDMDLESLLGDGIRVDELELCRSGSAPPTVQGSRAAYRSLLGNIEDNENDEEEQLRKHPDYLSYYLENRNNLNPRLPLPVGSREDWRAKQRFRSLRNGNETEDMNNSLFKDDRFVGLGIGISERRKSFADAIQQDPIHVPPIYPHPSRPISNIACNPSNDITLAQICEMDALRSCSTSPSLAKVQSLGSRMSQSFASAVVGPSHPRSTTPDPIARPTSRGPAIDIDMAAAFSCLSISNDKKPDGDGQLYNNTHIDQNKYLQQNSITRSESFSTPLLSNNGYSNQMGAMSAVASNGQCGYQEFSPSRNLSKQATSNGQFAYQEYYPSKNLSKQAAPLGTTSPMGSNGNYLTEMVNFDITAHSPNSYRTSPGAGMVNSPHGQYLSRDHAGSFQTPIVDPPYAQTHYMNVDQMDMSVYNKAYLAKFLAQQRMIQGGSYMGETDALKNGFFRNSVVDLHMPYSTSIRENTVRHNDMLSRIDTTALRTGVGSKPPWNHLNGIMEQGFASTKLEEFKTNKTRSFELSEIVGHVVEFSGDQYGSRFIQQKLETASDEEKNILFPEILANSRSLMIDVFGNYVIQKFFEHGTENQRSQLANQLMGHVLALSLQMYGCRVIQKALEVVNVDQQTQMVSELDGAVMRCVRDQNGNHVIQKCIECLPEDRIQFIICSFYGQVVALSTHPYGCRVIQRVLEHCTNEKTQSIMMEEILQSVCTLAQDQYGNYVIQHVLQHGKQEERAYIIGQLAGQIVKMSQQKFASNVVEKCLSFGSPKERQVLIDEMLGSTDENEPLQAMMKDQFGNYVVQKVLETCDDQNRELILSRVKVHLNALKKYTYGKHIVARVEKLITAGERRSERPPSYAT